MYEALINSLTHAEYEHIIPDLDIASVDRIKNGPTLFKLIINKFTIYTRSTVTVIRKSLGNLDQYLVTVDGNLRKFMKYVKLNKLG